MGKTGTRPAPPLPYEPPQLTYTYLGSYLLVEDFTFTVGGRRFTVPAGFRTDLASTPRLFWWWIPPTGAYEAAAVAHDWMVTDGIRLGLVTSREADAFFRDLMGEAEVRRARRWLMWTAVRWAAPLSAHRRPSGVLRDLPRMAPISAAVLAAATAAVYGLDRLAHTILGG